MKNNKILILGIESSCDDTGAAIVNEDFKVYSNIVSSQTIHEKFGGVLPELASREHIRNILPIIDIALKSAEADLDDIDAVAVSTGPGLIGSLLVGLSFAKSFAYALGKPLIAVNHILGHVWANFLEYPELSFPFLALIVSGGHTELVHFIDERRFKVLGKTVDDAAGEAFDKIGKLLGLPYPGGPAIDKISQKGDKNKIQFPLPMIDQDNFNFSFSGLKTASALYLRDNKITPGDPEIYDFASSFQNAIVEVLFRKTISALHKLNLNTIVLAGGVAANTALRNQFSKYGEKHNISLFFPSPQLCTDNAAMIAAAGITKYRNKEFAHLSINASSIKGLYSV
jgi:N6-L-threonylcarbamoyladenine synthase